MAQKIIFIACLSFALAIALIAFSGCAKILPDEPEPAYFKTCDSNSDCVIANGKGCCGCPTAINGKYLEEWNKRPRANCGNVQCTACPSKENLIPACMENRCSYTHRAAGNL